MIMQIHFLNVSPMFLYQDFSCANIMIMQIHMFSLL